MEEIVVKRVFHPAGQGAFFTEQFYDMNQDKLLYNVVYDCGSTSVGIKNQMECDIRNSFHEKKTIDVLFLSHFDNDHVNYVKHLKDNGYLHGTRIFIPMLAAEEWLGIDPYVTNYHFILSLHEQAKAGTKVIRVRFDEGDSEERGNDNSIEPQRIEDIQNDTIPSGTPLVPQIQNANTIWYYIPFNIQFQQLISDFKALLQKEGLDYARLRDVDYVIDNNDKLKKIYQGLGKKPSGGTAINLNSLQVMSYPKNPQGCSFFMNWAGRGKYCYCRYRMRMGYAGSCLYTGDTSANEVSVLKRIEQMVETCLGQNERLHLLQVPHHGSRHSYDQKLLGSGKYCVGFTNYAPYYRQHIFDDDLPMKFALNNKPLLLVTREYESQYEEYWKIFPEDI